MEIHRHKNSAGNKFSFPRMPIQDQEFDFEFGCVTPDSPNSPADHLFLNGRLLPHPFPFQPTTVISTYSRSTSSISSNNSLKSSRSNSTNSRSSSARTSTSEASEGKVLESRVKVVNRIPVLRERNQANRPVLTAPYESSQRWQFLAPVPVLNHRVSRRKKGETVVQEVLRAKKLAEDKNE